MPMVLTTMSRQAVSGSTKKPMSALKPVAGIQFQSVMPAPVSGTPKVWVRAAKATIMATTQDATTAVMATLWMLLGKLRPSRPVMMNPASGMRGMNGVTKGAGEPVAQACGLQPPAIEALEARVSESALKGYRTLAVAQGPETGALALVGLVTLYDPPRPDAKQLIAALHDLGVAVKMLTGDALAVAGEIAREVGLPNIQRVADLKAAGAKAGS